MKKLVFLLTLIFLITSCEKEEFFNFVRVENQHDNDIHCIIAGVDFGIVNSGTTTNYMKVPGGTNDLEGNLNGTITLPDETKLTKDKRFTVTIDHEGKISLVEDL